MSELNWSDVALRVIPYPQIIAAPQQPHFATTGTAAVAAYCQAPDKTVLCILPLSRKERREHFDEKRISPRLLV